MWVETLYKQAQTNLKDTETAHRRRPTEAGGARERRAHGAPSRRPAAPRPPCSSGPRGRAAEVVTRRGTEPTLRTRQRASHGDGRRRRRRQRQQQRRLPGAGGLGTVPARHWRGEVEAPLTPTSHRAPSPASPLTASACFYFFPHLGASASSSFFAQFGLLHDFERCRSLICTLAVHP